MTRAVLTLSFCLLTAVAGRAETFMAGASRSEVEAEMGDPLREIKTGKGALLFYGSVFLELEEQSVVFINVLSEDDLERRRQRDAQRGIYWGPSMPDALSEDDATPALARTMTPDEADYWEAKKQRERERVIETRVRRFLLTRTFVSMKRLGTSRAAPSMSWRHRPGAASVSLVAIKDSQGRPVRAIGETGQYVERQLDFEETFLSDTLLAQADVR